MDFSLKIVGDYQLLSRIGSGSFSQVYRAVHLPTSTSVAVKAMGRADFALAQREINLTCSLSHPNIVGCIDCFETPEHLFLVLEYCEMDLFHALTTRLLSPAICKQIFSEILRGVEHAHSRGIYHRDLKPENVLLSDDPLRFVRLADFGLATTKDYSTELGCGSVRYMSPEALPSEHNYAYTPAKNDVWSLGVLLLNIISTRNPWHVASHSDTHYDHFVTQDKAALKEAFDLTEPLFGLLLDVFFDESHRIDVFEFRERFEQIEWLCEGHKPHQNSKWNAKAGEGHSARVDDVAMYVNECIIKVDSLDETPNSPITPTLMFEVSLGDCKREFSS